MGDIHYSVSGSGPTVVMLHGGTGSSETYWAGQVPELSRSFNVIVMDHRGFGQSEHAGTFAIEACARDVVAVLDKEGVERANLVGLSLGGAVAMQTALDHPSRVRRLVLADTFSAVRTERFRRFIDYALIGSLRAGGYELMANINSIFAHGEGFLSAENPVNSGESWSQARIDAYVGALEEIRDWDIDDQLQSITAPTLIVWGSDDIEVPREYSERLSTAMPNAIMTVIPNAGHKSCTDRPDLFNKLVRTFLARVS